MGVQIGRKIIIGLLGALLWLPISVCAQEPATPATPATPQSADSVKVATPTKATKSRRAKKEVVSVSEDFKAAYKVSSGGRIYIPRRTPQSDSLRVVELSRQIDSLLLVRDSLDTAVTAIDSAAMINLDSLTTQMSGQRTVDEKIAALTAERTIYLPRQDSLPSEADQNKIDSTELVPRYSRVFRKQLPFALVTGISAVVPGFAQLYEEKYWKIPVEYVGIGVPLYFGLKQNSLYTKYANEYNRLKVTNADQSLITPVQEKMYRHGAYRTLLLGAAAGVYMGFLVDGIVNYPSELSRIQKATTLSMVCPGAGQVYNGSYWKVPIVVGGLASMFYVIDWNSRGYNRFKIAYEQVTDGDPSTVDEWNGAYTDTQLKNYKDLYRRNRDLAIIGLVGVYLVQVADAHIDAHMQAYDITDDLSMTIRPTLDTRYTFSGCTNSIGMNMAIYF
ncbi:MAG: DUF5683 domain-containing protein [Tidjanibacter sp.]|nr:DUF5683 domain-containing protein [Tidjanibacter sp.]